MRSITSEESKSSESEQQLYLALVAIATTAIVIRGEDAFASSLNLENNMKAARNIALLFDKTGGIQELSDSFDEGIGGVVKCAASNPRILLNPFIVNLAAIQAIELCEIYMVAKYFPYTPTGTLALFLATEKTGFTTATVAGPIFSAFARGMADIAKKACVESFRKELERNIKTSVSNLVFVDGNNQAVLRETGIAGLANDYKGSLDKIIYALLQVNKALVVPKPVGLSLREIFEQYPSLILTKEFVQNFAGANKITEAAKIIAAYLSSEKNPEDTDCFSKLTPISFGGGPCLNVVVNPDGYASNPNTMQNIMKLGAGSAMCELITRHANKPNNTLPYQLSNRAEAVLTFLRLIKDGAYSLSYIAQLNWLGIGSGDITNVEYKVGMISEMVTPDMGNTLHGRSPQEIFEIAQRIMQKPKSGMANVELSNDGNLHLQGYHLHTSNGEENKLNLTIENLCIEKSKVTALNGKNGSGKTTLLNSIAGCLPAAFDSEGTVLLPTNDNENPAPIIYCGSQVFNPPGCTLFEQIAFRIPTALRQNNTDNLAQDIKNLAKSLGDSANDIVKNLEKKNVELSRGQECITLVIGSLLYRQHLKNEGVEEATLIFDETFPNIDVTTQETIFKLIRSMCTEDIVLFSMGLKELFITPNKTQDFLTKLLISHNTKLTLTIRLIHQN